jgi:hypothetical protein
MKPQDSGSITTAVTARIRQWASCRTAEWRSRCSAAVILVACVAVTGCGGGAPLPTSGNQVQYRTTLIVTAVDVTGAPIAGATVTVTDEEASYASTTGANGTASFANLAAGEATVSISAADFETLEFALSLQRSANSLKAYVRAVGEWAIGTSLVLGTSVIERTSDGHALTFDVDVAVIDRDGAALETLTGTDFSLMAIDCGWGGPRDCASDAAGNATGESGSFSPAGSALTSGLRSPAARRAYVADIVVERSIATAGWDSRVSALTAFFSGLGGNDRASLATVQMDDWITTFTPFGPFTNDGSRFIDGIAGLLTEPTGPQPLLLEPLQESIRRVADAAQDPGFPGDPFVVVLGAAWLTVPEMDSVVATASQHGVRIATIGNGEFGLTEAAMRTGGFIHDAYDWRQLDMVFGAMDQLLSGTLPSYRLRFRIEGTIGTFVPGGNAKIRLLTRVPTTIPTFGIVTTFDVAIP